LKLTPRLFNTSTVPSLSPVVIVMSGYRYRVIAARKPRLAQHQLAALEHAHELNQQ
jgi:hypothetical protein